MITDLASIDYMDPAHMFGFQIFKSSGARLAAQETRLMTEDIREDLRLLISKVDSLEAFLEDSEWPTGEEGSLKLKVREGVAHGISNLKYLLVASVDSSLLFRSIFENKSEDLELAADVALKIADWIERNQPIVANKTFQFLPTHTATWDLVSTAITSYKAGELEGVSFVPFIQLSAQFDELREALDEVYTKYFSGADMEPRGDAEPLASSERVLTEDQKILMKRGGVQSPYVFGLPMSLLIEIFNDSNDLLLDANETVMEMFRDNSADDSIVLRGYRELFLKERRDKYELMLYSFIFDSVIEFIQQESGTRIEEVDQFLLKEALKNASLYPDGANMDSILGIGWKITATGVQVDIVDQGSPFDPEVRAKPADIFDPFYYGDPSMGGGIQSIRSRLHPLQAKKKMVGRTIENDAGVSIGKVVSLYFDAVDLGARLSDVSEEVRVLGRLLTDSEITDKGAVVQDARQAVKLNSKNIGIPPYASRQVIRVDVAGTASPIQLMSLEDRISKKGRSTEVILVDKKNHQNQISIRNVDGSVVLTNHQSGEVEIVQEKPGIKAVQKYSFLERTKLGKQFLDRLLNITAPSGMERRIQIHDALIKLAADNVVPVRRAADNANTTNFFVRNKQLTWSKQSRKDKADFAFDIYSDREQKPRFMMLVDRWNPENYTVFEFVYDLSPEKQVMQIVSRAEADEVIRTLSDEDARSENVALSSVKDGRRFYKAITRRLTKMEFGMNGFGGGVLVRFGGRKGEPRVLNVLKSFGVTTASSKGIKGQGPDDDLQDFPIVVFKHGAAPTSISSDGETFPIPGRKEIVPTYLSIENDGERQLITKTEIERIDNNFGSVTEYRRINPDVVLTAITFLGSDQISVKGIEAVDGRRVVFENVKTLNLETIVNQLKYSKFMQPSEGLIDEFETDQETIEQMGQQNNRILFRVSRIEADTIYLTRQGEQTRLLSMEQFQQAGQVIDEEITAQGQRSIVTPVIQTGDETSAPVIQSGDEASTPVILSDSEESKTSNPDPSTPLRSAQDDKGRNAQDDKGKSVQDETPTPVILTSTPVILSDSEESEDSNPDPSTPLRSAQDDNASGRDPSTPLRSAQDDKGRNAQDDKGRNAQDETPTPVILASTPVILSDSEESKTSNPDPSTPLRSAQDDKGRDAQDEATTPVIQSGDEESEDGARLAELPKTEAFRQITEFINHPLERSLAEFSDRLNALQGQEIGPLNNNGQITFRPAPGYPYKWPVLGEYAEGYTAYIDSAEMEEGNIKLTVRARNSDSDKADIVRIFWITSQEKILHGRNDKKGTTQTVRLITNQLESPTPVREFLEEIIQLSPDTNFARKKGLKERLDALKGKSVGTTTLNGQIALIPEGNFIYGWIALQKAESGYEGILEDAGIENGLIRFDFRFSKKDQPDIVRTFWIGPYADTARGQNNELGKTLPVLKITPFPGKEDVLSLLKLDPETDFTKIPKQLLQAKGHLIGDVRSGQVALGVDEDFSYSWPIFGSAESDYIASIDDVRLDGNLIRLRIRFDNTGQVNPDRKRILYRTLWVTHVPHIVSGVGKKKGQKYPILLISDEPALDLIRYLTAYPEDVDFSQLPEYYKNFKGQSVGVTDTNGWRSFTPVEHFHYPWGAIGMKRAGYRGEVTHTKVVGKRIQFSIQFTKSGEAVIERHFQIGPFKKNLKHTDGSGRTATVWAIESLDAVKDLTDTNGSFNAEAVGRHLDVLQPIIESMQPSERSVAKLLLEGDDIESIVSRQGVTNQFVGEIKTRLHDAILGYETSGSRLANSFAQNFRGQKQVLQNDFVHPIHILGNAYSPNQITSQIFRGEEEGLRVPQLLPDVENPALWFVGAGTLLDVLETARKMQGHGSFIGSDIGDHESQNMQANLYEWGQRGFKPAENISIFKGDLFEVTPIGGKKIEIGRVNMIAANLPLPGGGGSAAGSYQVHDAGGTLLKRVLKEAPSYLTDDGILALSYNEDARIYSELYKSGWEPILIDGLNRSRRFAGQASMTDYVRIFMVRQRGVEKRSEYLNRLTTEFEQIAVVARNEAPSNQQFAIFLLDLVNRYKDSSDFGEQLLFKSASDFLQTLILSLQLKDVPFQERFPMMAQRFRKVNVPDMRINKEPVYAQYTKGLGVQFLTAEVVSQSADSAISVIPVAEKDKIVSTKSLGEAIRNSDGRFSSVADAIGGNATVLETLSAQNDFGSIRTHLETYMALQWIPKLNTKDSEALTEIILKFNTSGSRLTSGQPLPIGEAIRQIVNVRFDVELRRHRGLIRIEYLDSNNLLQSVEGIYERDELLPYSTNVSRATGLSVRLRGQEYGEDYVFGSEEGQNRIVSIEPLSADDLPDWWARPWLSHATETIQVENPVQLQVEEALQDLSLFKEISQEKVIRVTSGLVGQIGSLIIEYFPDYDRYKVTLFVQPNWGALNLAHKEIFEFTPDFKEVRRLFSSAPEDDIDRYYSGYLDESENFQEVERLRQVMQFFKEHAETTPSEILKIGLPVSDPNLGFGDRGEWSIDMALQLIQYEQFGADEHETDMKYHDESRHESIRKRYETVTDEKLILAVKTLISRFGKERFISALENRFKRDSRSFRINELPYMPHSHMGMIGDSIAKMTREATDNSFPIPISPLQELGKTMDATEANIRTLWSNLALWIYLHQKHPDVFRAAVDTLISATNAVWRKEEASYKEDPIAAIRDFYPTIYEFINPIRPDFVSANIITEKIPAELSRRLTQNKTITPVIQSGGETLAPVILSEVEESEVSGRDPSTPLRFAQDDNASGSDPSTPLRSAQDDNGEMTQDETPVPVISSDSREINSEVSPQDITEPSTTQNLIRSTPLRFTQDDKVGRAQDETPTPVILSEVEESEVSGRDPSTPLRSAQDDKGRNAQDDKGRNAQDDKGRNAQDETPTPAIQSGDEALAPVILSDSEESEDGARLAALPEETVLNRELVQRFFDYGYWVEVGKKKDGRVDVYFYHPQRNVSDSSFSPEEGRRYFRDRRTFGEVEFIDPDYSDFGESGIELDHVYPNMPRKGLKLGQAAIEIAMAFYFDRLKISEKKFHIPLTEDEMVDTFLAIKSTNATKQPFLNSDEFGVRGEMQSVSTRELAYWKQLNQRNKSLSIQAYRQKVEQGEMESFDGSRLAFDSRSVEAGLSSEAFIRYDEAVKSVVNPNDEPQRVIYGGSGVDIVHFLKTFNATDGIFVNDANGLSIADLKIVQQLMAFGLENLKNRVSVKKYREHKMRKGYAYHRYFNDPYFVFEILAYELVATGIKTINIVEDGAFPAIQFKWSYHPDGKENNYQIQFVEADITKPNEYPEGLRLLIEEGFDRFYTRAGVYIPTFYSDSERSFVSYLYQHINENGFFVTDDFGWLDIHPSQFSAEEDRVQDFGPNLNLPAESTKVISVDGIEVIVQELLGYTPITQTVPYDYYGWHVRVRQILLQKKDRKPLKLNSIDALGSRLAENRLKDESTYLSRAKLTSSENQISGEVRNDKPVVVSNSQYNPQLDIKVRRLTIEQIRQSLVEVGSRYSDEAWHEIPVADRLYGVKRGRGPLVEVRLADQITEHKANTGVNRTQTTRMNSWFPAGEINQIRRAVSVNRREVKNKVVVVISSGPIADLDLNDPRVDIYYETFIRLAYLRDADIRILDDDLTRRKAAETIEKRVRASYLSDGKGQKSTLLNADELDPRGSVRAVIRAVGDEAFKLSGAVHLSAARLSKGESNQIVNFVAGGALLIASAEHAVFETNKDEVIQIQRESIPDQIIGAFASALGLQGQSAPESVFWMLEGDVRADQIFFGAFLVDHVISAYRFMIRQISVMA